MPLLFAMTLFLSASLLFMVQPMVGKMVLPLLGGSPAVWNACMVFFQALLLLGYLYSHHISEKYTARKQWLIHLLVLGLPLGAFMAAAMFSARHSPIAIVESLAPGEGSSPVMRVLMLLSIAIGVPFLVVSTSAPLLQKWFTCTGHPSSRDPYFLYAASNLGSMISLLGYPLFIEPSMSIAGQAWLFAIGFAVLAVLIAVCGYAAAHPMPASTTVSFQGGKLTVKGGQKGGLPASKPVDPPEPPPEAAPTLARKIKWVALAFVPSSMMLGVTFYMTTDIASIPLLWVLPLTLYLITFIIAFARVPDWFRLVIGNLAPVMILLLVFVKLSREMMVTWSVTLEVGLYLTAFFAAALMCHYELARDRPSTRFLTNFFLLMSVGGVLGGVFNSLVAPVVFPYAYEFPIILVVACLMVPNLTEDDTVAASKPKAAGESEKKSADKSGFDAAKMRQGPDVQDLLGDLDRRKQQIALALDVAIPVLVGGGYYLLLRFSTTETFAAMCNSITSSTGIGVRTIEVMLLNAPIVMLCFFFVDRPLRFALSVAAILGYYTYIDSGRGLFYSTRSFFGILKVERYTSEQRPVFTRETADGKKEVATSGQIIFNRLVHGTTLHGTQISEMTNNVFDMFQTLTALNPLENFVIAHVNHRFDPRAEPLTYYHRTGPVGAMFQELRTRKGGADAKAPVAMVGLGSGSVSCYALPEQHLTFYEIDQAVLDIVEKPKMVMNKEERKKNPDLPPVMGPFTYVDDARNRGALIDFRMGDARIKLKEDEDRKYALLLVDAFSSDSIPIHLLTKEAVQLYFDRLTPDGMLALHISNKFVRLEPVVAAIAKELGVTARVWNDGERGGPGKTASSWVVLARTPENLGGLYQPEGNLIFTGHPTDPDERPTSMDAELWKFVYYDYSDELGEGKPRTRVNELNQDGEPKKAWLGWIKTKLDQEKDPIMRARLLMYADLINETSVITSLQSAMMDRYGHAFHHIEPLRDVSAWTDDYSDVLRVLMLPEVQRVRKFFGMPTPVER